MVMESLFLRLKHNYVSPTALIQLCHSSRVDVCCSNSFNVNKRLSHWSGHWEDLSALPVSHAEETQSLFLTEHV